MGRVVAPEGFKGQWFPLKRSVWFWFLGLLSFLLPNRSGIGVGDEGLVLRGFGTKVLPWDDIESIGALGGGLAAAALRSMVVRSRSRGTLALPVHQTQDPQGLLAALAARGFSPQR